MSIFLGAHFPLIAELCVLAPHVGSMRPPVCQADCCGWSSGLACPQLGWLTCFVWGCWPGWGGCCVTRQLAIDPQGTPGLMLAYWWAECGYRRCQGCFLPSSGWSWFLGLLPAHWWAEPGFGDWIQGPQVPELVLDCWWVGPVLDTGGCGVQWT